MILLWASGERCAPYRGLISPAPSVEIRPSTQAWKGTQRHGSVELLLGCLNKSLRLRGTRVRAGSAPTTAATSSPARRERHMSGQRLATENGAPLADSGFIPVRRLNTDRPGPHGSAQWSGIPRRAWKSASGFLPLT